jgi:hypothetical protein
MKHAILLVNGQPFTLRKQFVKKLSVAAITKKVQTKIFLTAFLTKKLGFFPFTF